MKSCGSATPALVAPNSLTAKTCNATRGLFIQTILAHRTDAFTVLTQHANTVKMVPKMDFRVRTTANGTSGLAHTKLDRNTIASAKEYNRGHCCAINIYIKYKMVRRMQIAMGCDAT
jgi:hypothetical protein